MLLVWLFLFLFLLLVPVIGILIVSRDYNNSKQNDLACSKIEYFISTIDLSFIIIMIGVLLRISLSPLSDLYFFRYFMLIFIILSIYSLLKMYKSDSMPSFKDIFILFARVSITIYIIYISKSQLFYLLEYSLFIAFFLIELCIEGEFKSINFLSAPLGNILNLYAVGVSQLQWNHICDRLLITAISISNNSDVSSVTVSQVLASGNFNRRETQAIYDYILSRGWDSQKTIYGKILRDTVIREMRYRV